jgi:hypothetical protein
MPGAIVQEASGYALPHLFQESLRFVRAKPESRAHEEGEGREVVRATRDRKLCRATRASAFLFAFRK